MRRVSVVVEIKDRPGERCWGKLYVPVKEDKSDCDSEWLATVAEANSFMDGGFVDEAVDTSNEFGI
jgi:hypothetical protein